MKGIIAHELARILLAGPDLPVATHANNHTSHNQAGPMRVGIMFTHRGDRVIIGNLSRKRVNYPNEHVIKTTDGGPELPDDWEPWC